MKLLMALVLAFLVLAAYAPANAFAARLFDGLLRVLRGLFAFVLLVVVCTVVVCGLMMVFGWKPDLGQYRYWLPNS